VVKKFWKVIILVFVAGIMAGDLILDYRSQPQAHAQDVETAELLGLNVGTTVGDLAPNFTGTTVDGEIIALSDLKGKVVLVNVFASWCGPCRVEAPHLVEVYNSIDKGGFEFIGLNLQEAPDAVEGFQDEFLIDFPLVLNEGGDLTNIYSPIGLPTTWFIDQVGVVRFVFSGPMTKESLQAILNDVEAGREPDPFAVIG
jgi:thiol-disulfide isomerase/thioredoxin